MDIPKDAKCAYRGKLFDVYQWKQKMFDGSYETFEMAKRKPTVDIIAVASKKIMVLAQEQPGRKTYPALPGGRIEKKETSVETAKRELLEETGYKAKEIELFKEFFGNSKLYFHESVFLAKDCKIFAKQKLDSGEKIKVKFIDFDEFLQLCREDKFAVPIGLKHVMYEALIDNEKKEELRNILFKKI